MKRKRMTGWFIVALAGLLAHAHAADMMSVQVRKGAVRATPSFLGRVQAALAYGDRVTIVEKKSPWMKVKTADGADGWMHESALSPRKIVLTAGKGEAGTGASSDELALAGKGFNSDVEAEFKAKHGSANFAAVDRMEKRTASQSQIVAFLKDGGVTPTDKERGAK